MYWNKRIVKGFPNTFLFKTNEINAIGDIQKTLYFIVQNIQTLKI